MNISQFLRSQASDQQRSERLKQFDPERMDYTLKIQKPDGEVVILRNPKEFDDGVLTDKQHTVPEGSNLIAAGTASWDWRAKKQLTVGIDFDTNDNHAAGLTSVRFNAVLEAVRRVPWLEVRRSTGGKGLHAYPRFTQPVDVATRAEASALARAVLILASRVAGFDFKAAKDCAGGNMWFFKADAAPNAYEVIKEATEALDPEELPPGWREAKEACMAKIKLAPATVELSSEHLEMEKHLLELPYSVIYRNDLGCYHIHTYALQEAHRRHGYHGYFATISKGTDPGQPNGYMFPLPGGAFLVKRFGNAQEHPSWFHGQNGDYALLNTEVPFEKAVQHFSRNSTTKGYSFTRANLEAMLQAIGVWLEIPDAFSGRTLFVKTSKGDARITVEKQDSDAQPADWTSTGTTWQRSFPTPPTPSAFAHAEAHSVSDIVRAVTTDTESAKWFIKTDGLWIGAPASEVSKVLAANGVQPILTMGLMREKPYWLVFEPFREEYLPGRRWNREAPQLACEPADEAGDTPTWDAIFNHLGNGLDEDIAADEICQSRGITSGAQYLMLWTKLLIEKPHQRTPYLFFTSRQNNTGKTSLGSSICHLINPGVAEINEEALVDKFTGELEGKVLCLIEELDLRDERRRAYAMLKRILTSKTLTIRKMRTDAYNVPNFTHFIHTANDANFVPVETEDMRIVKISVPPISRFIETIDFEEGIRREAPFMLRKLLDMPLPEPYGRFFLPVVQTSLKENVLSGIYDTETTEAEEGLKKFAETFLTKDPRALAPATEVLGRYVDFCIKEKLPQVPKPGFLKALRDKAGMPVDKKQKRVNGKQVWHYMGLSLKA